MHTPSETEIQQFFENITPADFAQAPTVTALSTETELYPRHGAEEFERFTLDCLHRLAEDEEPFACLHNGTEARRYAPRESEELVQFLSRLHKEAKIFAAKWFFIGTPGEASMGEVFNPNEPEEVERARREGKMMEVVNWYSESRERTSVGTRFGIITNKHGERQIVQSTFEAGANPEFKRVLRF